MSEQQDGGPAFPVSTNSKHSDVRGPYGHQDSTQTWQFPGMTLRDYFAAQVLPVAAVGAFRSGEDFLRGDHYEDAASNAYALADAMLKARAG